MEISPPWKTLRFQDFSGLDQLTFIGGMIDLCHNIRMVNFGGLDQVTSIGGNFYAYHLSSLKSFSGLDNLQTIGGEFDIGSNVKLASLKGLSSLQSVADCFYIFGNESLESIEDLESLEHIGGTLTIIRNEALESCQISGLCEYLGDPPGSVSIWENGKDCSSPTQVLQDCAVTPLSEVNEKNIFLMPNPARSNVELIGLPSNNYEVQIFNRQGSPLKITSIPTSRIIDVQTLRPGVYWISISKGRTYFTRTLVKL